MTTPAHAQKKNTFKFLSHEQFQKLTEPEKKSYLKEIRNLLEEMTENAKVSVFQYLFLPKASALEVESFKNKSSDTSTELGLLDSLLSFNRAFKKVKDQPNMDASKSEYELHTQSFIRRMKAVREKVNTPDFIRRYQQLYNEFQRDYPQHAQEVSPIQETATSVATKSRSTTTQNQSQTQSQVPKRSQHPAQSKSDAITNSSNSPYCIHAGFVIYGDKCSPNKKLPTDFVLSEIRTDMFKCEIESEILCNPLLFGFKKNCFKVETKEVCSEIPICIERSVNATKNCLKLSDTTEQLNQVLELWKNPKNKDVYEKFTKDLNQLCNPENIASNDIRQTCQMAARRFNKIIETNYPGKGDFKIRTTEPVKTNK